MIFLAKLVKENKQEDSLPWGWKKYSNSFLKSISAIARKYTLNTYQLAEAFAESLKNGTSHCGNLTIQCREVGKDFATFLITNQEAVVSQFPIKLECLKQGIPKYLI